MCRWNGLAVGSEYRSRLPEEAPGEGAVREGRLHISLPRVVRRPTHGASLISRAGPWGTAMVSTLQKALAVLVCSGFFMMIIGPLASIGTWLAGLAVAFIFVPLIVLLTMSWSRDRTKERGKGLLEHTGLTPEEWAEQSDPDDFEGEDD